MLPPPQPQPSTLIGPDFNIDTHLNPFIPRPRLDLLPTAISWFLGYRSGPERPVGSVLKWLWGAVGAFVGILVVEAVFMTPALKSEGSPVVIGSLGAAAILHFSVLASPLSQPRNAIISQILASAIGVSMAKLFEHSPHFESLRYLAGALAVALTSLAMGVTGTIHPPAGATALLAATSPEILKIGWFLIPLVLLGSVLLVGVACVVGNVQQRWPVYWWTAIELPVKKAGDDVERQGSIVPSEADTKVGISDKEGVGNDGDDRRRKGEVVIDAENIVIPDWLQLGYEQRAVLEILQAQLRDGRLGRTRTMETDDTDETRVFRS